MLLSVAENLWTVEKHFARLRWCPKEAPLLSQVLWVHIAWICPAV